MPQSVKILNWNIQNYGVTKTSFPDIVRAIAGVVLSIRPDIFVLLELNTTRQADAATIVTALANQLVALTGGEYRVVVLSPNTGLEFYAFFVRDAATTIPLLARTATGAAIPRVGGAVALTAARFVEPAIPAAGVQVLQNFPLMVPDAQPVSLRGRPLSIPSWAATRLPVLGTFWCPAAAAANRLLPIVACHFAPNSGQAYLQYRIARYFSLLRGLGPPPPQHIPAVVPVALQVKLAGAAVAAQPTHYYVLTGDFNIDYVPGDSNYAALTNNVSPDLGATGLITDNTHLTTYANYSPRTMKTPEALAVSNYDNFFLRVDPAAAGAAQAAGGPAAPDVYELARRVYRGGVTFNQSVTHYAALDQRGFSSNAYAGFGTDFVNQLTVQGNNINVKGALVGTRMISDHLPVSFTLTIT